MASSVSQATPLRLDYTKDYGGNGLTYYTFTLTLQNQDSSWTPGQSWDWLLFGDAPSLGDGAFADFTLISTTGNWNQVSHAERPLQWRVDRFRPLRSWTPLQVGDFISWRGSSTSDVIEWGDLLQRVELPGRHSPFTPRPTMSPPTSRRHSTCLLTPAVRAARAAPSSSSSSGGITDPDRRSSRHTRARHHRLDRTRPRRSRPAPQILNRLDLLVITSYDISYNVIT